MKGTELKDWLNQLKERQSKDKSISRNDQVKQIIIKQCRTYLQNNKYKWTEEESQTTNSYYFHIMGDKISDWQTPVIRISDHTSVRGRYRLAEFLVDDIGKHTPPT